MIWLFISVVTLWSGAECQMWFMPQEDGPNPADIFGSTVGHRHGQCPSWGAWESSKCLWPTMPRSSIPKACQALPKMEKLPAFIKKFIGQKVQEPYDRLQAEFKKRGSTQACGVCARKVRCRTREEGMFSGRFQHRFRHHCKFKEVEVLPDACAGTKACELSVVDGGCPSPLQGLGHRRKPPHRPRRPHHRPYRPRFPPAPPLPGPSHRRHGWGPYGPRWFPRRHHFRPRMFQPDWRRRLRFRFRMPCTMCMFNRWNRRMSMHRPWQRRFQPFWQQRQQPPLQYQRPLGGQFGEVRTPPQYPQFLPSYAQYQQPWLRDQSYGQVHSGFRSLPQVQRPIQNNYPAQMFGNNLGAFGQSFRQQGAPMQPQYTPYQNQQIFLRTPQSSQYPGNFYNLPQQPSNQQLQQSFEQSPPPPGLQMRPETLWGQGERRLWGNQRPMVIMFMRARRDLPVPFEGQADFKGRQFPDQDVDPKAVEWSGQPFWKDSEWGQNGMEQENQIDPGPFVEEQFENDFEENFEDEDMEGGFPGSGVEKGNRTRGPWHQWNCVKNKAGNKCLCCCGFYLPNVDTGNCESIRKYLPHPWDTPSTPLEDIPMRAPPQPFPQNFNPNQNKYLQRLQEGDFPKEGPPKRDLPIPSDVWGRGMNQQFKPPTSIPQPPPVVESEEKEIEGMGEDGLGDFWKEVYGEDKGKEGEELNDEELEDLYAYDDGNFTYGDYGELETKPDGTSEETEEEAAEYVPVDDAGETEEQEGEEGEKEKEKEEVKGTQAIIDGMFPSLERLLRRA